MNQTTNYGLPLWEATDRVTRESVNGAINAIDAVLGGAGLRVFTGSLAGDGIDHDRTVTLGARPKVLFLGDDHTNDDSPSYFHFYIRAEGFNFYVPSNDPPYAWSLDSVAFTDTGFTILAEVGNTGRGFNRKNHTAWYLALC